MADLGAKILGTIILRPYVFVFLLVYLVAGFSQIGWKKTLAFLIIGYLTAFVSELLSIHTGIPYGLYHYLPLTREKELWIAGVPFMDSLSYVFLAYCSFATALFLLSPVYWCRSELLLLDTSHLRYSWLTLFLAAFLMTFLDIVIDPVALQGSKWFLGQIYFYPEGGLYFGVPLSNFGGWFIVGAIMVFSLQQIISWPVNTNKTDIFFSRLPWGSFLGVFLYVGILFFNVWVSYLIKEYPLALVNTFYVLLFLALCLCSVWYKLEKANPKDFELYVKEFPLGRPAYLAGNKIFTEASNGKNLHENRR